MKNLYTRVLFLSILSFSSCSDDQEPAVPSEEVDPIIEGSRKVNIIVDKAYDLSQTEAHSILESRSMAGEKKTLAIPEGFESAAFFLDNTSGEILAVVLTDTVSENLTVNAESVAEALLTLVPAYHSLTVELKEKFNREISASKPYKDFVITVDGLMKSKKTVYSTEDTYILQLLELNSYILVNYLEDPNLEGGRVTKKSSDDDFTNWLTRENGATLDNQVHSYLYAEFSPLSNGNLSSTILDPQPILAGLTSKVTLSELGLRDDCYTVRLNQTSPSVKSKNQLALATRVASMFMNAILGGMSDKSRNDCIAALAGSIQTDIATAVMGAANLSLADGLLRTIETAGNAINTAYTSTSCRTLLLNKSVIAKAMAAQSNVFVATIKVITTAYNFTELTPYILALWNPVELTEIIQLYDGKLREACVKVIKDDDLASEYGAGETIYPNIKLEPQSFYADWDKTGFTIKWIVDPGNGQVNLPESKTGSDGEKNVGWKLPDDKSGNVILKAEIRDKEGDHLTGSPLEFMVTVKLLDSLELYKASAVGKYLVGYTGNGPEAILYCELKADGGVVYTIYNSPSWPDGAPFYGHWTIQKHNGRYHYWESGFWHPGFPNIEVDLPLFYPVNSFVFHDSTPYTKL